MNRPSVRSRHNTHSGLRTKLERLPFRSIVRLGSTTSTEEINIERRSKGLQPAVFVELNSVDAVKNSSSKLKMKQCFTRDGVKTADWWVYHNVGTFEKINISSTDPTLIKDMPYPIVAKSHFGSRGEGNTLLNDRAELETWMRGKTLNNYIFEKYYNYSREYRLHISAEGCFYTCRKMLKRDAPEGNKWQRHDDNCVWILEENSQFDKPVNWNSIVEHSVKALNSVGLDVGAVDVRVQSRLDGRDRVRENPDFIIVEINSAPSFGELTEQHYLTQIPRILNRKRNA